MCPMFTDATYDSETDRNIEKCFIELDFVLCSQIF